MMTVTIKINDEVIDEVRIVNRGPVGGTDGASYDPGDHVGGDGLRRYDWTSKHHSGSTLHRRVWGARLLAADVLAELADEERQT